MLLMPAADAAIRRFSATIQPPLLPFHAFAAALLRHCFRDDIFPLMPCRLRFRHTLSRLITPLLPPILIHAAIRFRYYAAFDAD